MRRPHDHTLAVLDLKGQPLPVAEALFIHLPRALNRLHSDRGQRIADPLRVEAAGVPHRRLEDVYPVIAPGGMIVRLLAFTNY